MRKFLIGAAAAAAFIAATPAEAQYYGDGYSPYSYGYGPYYSYDYSPYSYGYSYPGVSFSFGYSYPSYGYNSYPSYGYYSYPSYGYRTCRHHHNGYVWYTRC